MLKSFFHWLSDRYDIPNITTKIRNLPESPPKQRVLTEEEYQKILAVCEKGSDEEAIVVFLRHTGLRASELQALQAGNIAGDKRSICIVGKGQKRRLVPLNATCQAVLEHKPNINFLENYRRRNNLYNLSIKLCRKAGVPSAGPHAYRHCFGTSAVGNMSIVTLQKILGHANLTTTQLYIHLSGKDLIGSTDFLDK